MTGSLFKIVDGVRFRRVHATLAIFVLAALLIGAGIVAAARSLLIGRDKIGEVRDRIATLEHRLSERLKRPGQVTIGGGNQNTSYLASNLGEAERQLQSRLRELPALLRSNAVQIESVRGLPSIGDSGLAAVRVSVSLSLPASIVFDMVNLIETSTPVILIDSIRVSSRPAFDPGQAVTARVQLLLRSFAAEKGAAQ